MVEIQLTPSKLIIAIVVFLTFSERRLNSFRIWTHVDSENELSLSVPSLLTVFQSE